MSNSSSKADFILLIKLHQYNNGFTLIELLITIIIVGVLAAIALPSFLGQIAKARGTEAKSNLGSINRAQQAYRYEHDRFALGVPELKFFGLAIDGKHYEYSVSGSTNTSTAFADPIQSDYKVYASGIAFGTDQRFDQVICESIDLESSTTNNTASAQTATGASGSAYCNVGKEIR
jgi:type IV pilus assembly protein PilA